jgi:hypothetical protein
MRHHDRLWRTRRHISAAEPANEPTVTTNDPTESTIEPGRSAIEPCPVERTRGGRMTQVRRHNLLYFNGLSYSDRVVREKQAEWRTDHPAERRTIRRKRLTAAPKSVIFPK